VGKSLLTHALFHRFVSIELATIRARLAANRRTEPLFDMARYARDFENRLLHIAQEHAQGDRS
jgi:predicted O-linked N-acetylglucosamine transferase (SPINDLY family)